MGIIRREGESAWILVRVCVRRGKCVCVRVWVRERESGRGTVILKRFFESGHAKYH